MSNPLFIKAPFLTRKNFFNTNKTNNVFCLIYPFYLSPHQTQVLELKNSRYSINRLFLTSKGLLV